ncbi:MAG TPA: hypothetical protein VGI96_01255 [Streptosporangiaceae bacterium]
MTAQPGTPRYPAVTTPSGSAVGGDESDPPPTSYRYRAAPARRHAGLPPGPRHAGHDAPGGTFTVCPSCVWAAATEPGRCPHREHGLARSRSPVRPGRAPGAAPAPGPAAQRDALAASIIRKLRNAW